MIEPSIDRAIKTGYPVLESRTTDCTYCGAEMQNGESVYAFPSENHWYCSRECVANQMIKEGNLENVILSGI